MATQLGFDFDAPAALEVPEVHRPTPRRALRDVAALPVSARGHAATTPSPWGERPALAGPAPEALAPDAGLAQRLAVRLGCPVRVTITNNRRIMLSARRREGFMVVRLHRMFLRCDDPTVHALARYLDSRDPRASRHLDRFVEAHRARIDDGPRRRITVRTSGEVHDLAALFDDLCERHFGERLEVTVTWGRRTAPRRRKRSIQLGTYCPETKVIRIHPVLDQPWVPAFYVESVLFHEMLHHDMGAEQQGSRQCFHTPAFRARERSFEQHALAVAWEKQHLGRLLRS